MKNKSHKSLAILSILVTITLLSSCNGTNGMNGAHYHQKHMHEKDKEEQAACPNCKEGSRFLYKLANKNHNLILICEECTSIWLEPNNIEWGQTASSEKLQSTFGVKDSQILFDASASTWATQDEAKVSEWKELAQTNSLLIK